MQARFFSIPSMAKDMIWQVGGTIVNRASFFIALLLLSSYMSLDNYGAFGLIYNLALSISSIISCGIGIVTRRELTGKTQFLEQKVILSSNICIIFILSCLFTAIVSIYQISTNNLSLDYLTFISLLLLLSTSASISHYLNFHYSGLSQFKKYNQILLPINVILPICLLIIQPQQIVVAILVMAIVIMLGNIWQIAFLKGFTFHFNYKFQKTFLKQFYPCFLQSILGLPVYVVLQMIIVERWSNIAFIGVILIATQILNMCNIFATKSLTVFSVSITKSLNLYKKVPFSLFMKYFSAYMVIVGVVHLVIWLVLPFIIKLLKNGMTDTIDDFRYFIVANLLISISWFLIEYFHAIKQSWISLVANILSSICIFLIFFARYYHNETFTLIHYANCLAFARIIPIALCLYLIIKSSKRVLR